MFETHDRKTPERISTVIFDLDDTLIDSLPARVEALREVFSNAGLSHSAEGVMRDNRGIPLSQTLRQLEVDMGRQLGLMENFRRAYWLKGTESIVLYPGVEPVLKKLRHTGIALGVVTQKRRSFDMDESHVGAHQELLQLGIAHLFSAVVGLDDVEQPKPNPEGVLIALGQIGAHSQETLVVGDAVTDIEAANAAGCWSCFATWGVPAEDRGPAQIKADFIAESPEDLLPLARR